MKTLLLRADANAQIGAGHLMRCLALAQAWQAEGGQANFALAIPAPALEARLSAEGMGVYHLSSPMGSAADADETGRLAQSLGACWTVVDGYDFDDAYQQSLKAAGLKLLCMDDYGQANHYYADVVVNQNIYADEHYYLNREPYTRLLLGTHYALLRREFWPWRGWQRETPEVARKVLVTLGGSDPDNVTLKVIQAIQHLSIPDLEAMVVVGGSNPHYARLLPAAASTPGIHLVRNVANMPELMAWADVAISGGGSTCWELAFMGLPSLLVMLAENQRTVAAGVARANAALNLGEHHSLTSVQIAEALTETIHQAFQRMTLSQQGQALVDGRGSQRVVDFMQKKLSLRPVRTEDNALIWEWANEDATRAASFSSEPIPWETHVAWFSERLDDPLCRFYLALDASDTPIGQIRYQMEDDAATISVSVASEFRGNGYGVASIRAGTQQLFADTLVKRVHAYIKPENVASTVVFGYAGFTEVEAVYIKGIKARHLVCERGMVE